MRMRMATSTPASSSSAPKWVLILASGLCFLSLLGIAQAQAEADSDASFRGSGGGGGGGQAQFSVEGTVYCDNCRAQFVTRISKYMAGARVKLECKEREGEAVTFTAEGETDGTGTYKIVVDGDHEEDVCEILLIKSSDPECSEISKESALDKKAARISLAKESGISSNVRHANPLGFMVKNRDPQCTQVLKELGITAQGLV